MGARAAPGDSSTDASASVDGGTRADGSNNSGSDSSPCPGAGYTGAVATFDLSAQPGNETSVAAGPSAMGIVVGALSRSPSLRPESSAGSINASNWPTAGDGGYYTFTVTPPSGCTLSLASLSIRVRASTDGPTEGDVATSTDGFATHVGALVNDATSSVTMSAIGQAAIEVRIYGFSAKSPSGTYRVENTVSLSGSLL
jgi:hypothetical protein